MPTLNYRKIPGALATLTPFKGNSMSGHAVTPGSYYGDVIYRVDSYDTAIAWVHQDGTVELNETKYSRTTSRQQNLVRAYLTRDAVQLHLLGVQGVPSDWAAAYITA